MELLPVLVHFWKSTLMPLLEFEGFYVLDKVAAWVTIELEIPKLSSLLRLSQLPHKRIVCLAKISEEVEQAKQWHIEARITRSVKMSWNHVQHKQKMDLEKNLNYHWIHWINYAFTICFKNVSRCHNSSFANSTSWVFQWFHN